MHINTCLVCLNPWQHNNIIFIKYMFDDESGAHHAHNEPFIATTKKRCQFSFAMVTTIVSHITQLAVNFGILAWVLTWDKSCIELYYIDLLKFGTWACTYPEVGACPGYYGTINLLASSSGPLSFSLEVLSIRLA